MIKCFHPILTAEQLAQKKLTSKLAKQKKAQSTKGSRVSSRKSTEDGFTSVRPSSQRALNAAPDRLPSAKRPVRRVAQDSLGMWAENSSDSSSGILGSKSRLKKASKKPTSGANFVGRNARLRVCINRDNKDDDESPVGQTSSREKAKETEIPKSTERNLEENEQLIIDLLSRTQPYMDHNYTSIFGKRILHENMLADIDLSDLENGDHAARSSGKRIKTVPNLEGTDASDANDKTLTLKVSAGTVPTLNNIHIPIIRLARIPVAPDGTPLVSAEEVVVQENDALEEIMRKHNIGNSNATSKNDILKHGLYLNLVSVGACM